MDRKESEHSKLNTDHLSLDPIWREDNVAELYFHNNDMYEDNSMDATLRFMHDSKIKAAREGFIDVTVEGYTQCDEGCLDTSYIVIKGWRKETKKEWRNRLRDEANRAKRFVMEGERAIKSAPVHKERQEQYEARLKTDMDLTTCSECGKLSSDDKVCEHCGETINIKCW